MTRLTLDAISAAPWRFTSTQYQAAAGVHAPWIAEISGTQHARMSKRGRIAYERQRTQEWQASGDIKAEWRRLVLAAHRDGRFDWREPGVSEEARRVVVRAMLDAENDRKAATLQQASRANRIASVDELRPGDRVYSLLTGRYGEVLRTHKVSARLRFDDGREWTEHVARLQWCSHHDLKAAAEAGRPVPPR